MPGPEEKDEPKDDAPESPDDAAGDSLTEYESSMNQALEDDIANSTGG